MMPSSSGIQKPTSSISRSLAGYTRSSISHIGGSQAQSSIHHVVYGGDHAPSTSIARVGLRRTSPRTSVVHLSDDTLSMDPSIQHREEVRARAREDKRDAYIRNTMKRKQVVEVLDGVADTQVLHKLDTATHTKRDIETLKKHTSQAVEAGSISEYKAKNIKKMLDEIALQSKK